MDGDFNVFLNIFSIRVFIGCFLVPFFLVTLHSLTIIIRFKFMLVLRTRLT